jgi:UDP-2,4-diacetamido-2,4,6-trideoxy-beta-L-altropyranose hydrolase
MAVDDLADRPHECDVLLDQNFANPLHDRYAALLPDNVRVLLGPHYALLRPEFAQLRETALARRHGQIAHVLVSMGATDPANDTAIVLAGLAGRATAWASLDVVIGEGNPHRLEVRALCERIPTAKLHIQTLRMAELMTHADLAVSGCGSTSWERCVLGLPAVATIQSPDQAASAVALQRLGAQRVAGRSGELTAADYDRAVGEVSPRDLIAMSSASARVCDGRGAARVATQLLSWKS